MTNQLEAEEPAAPSRPSRSPIRAAALMFAVLVCALAYLIYGPGISPNFVVGIPVLIAIPLSIGGLACAMIDPRGERSIAGCAAYPILFLLSMTLLAYLFIGEGAICIAMVLAIWLPVAAGALVHRWLSRRRVQEEIDSSIVSTSAWAALPALAFVLDASLPMQWKSHEVSREILLPATPDKVWSLVLSIPSVAPDEGKWTFTQDVLNVPRPSEARLVRRGDRLIRLARWGTDIRFEERITTLIKGRTIGWDFAFPDDSVQRHTDRHISPDGAHLQIVSGRYDLVAVEGGCTRLRLTTRYASRTQLDSYFALWGDRLLGDVQANVLAIIEGRVSAGNTAAPRPQPLNPCA